MRKAAEAAGIGLSFQVNMLKELLSSKKLMIPINVGEGGVQYQSVPISEEMIDSDGNIVFQGGVYSVGDCIPDRATQLKALQMLSRLSGTDMALAITAERHVRESNQAIAGSATKTNIALSVPRRKSISEVVEVEP